LIGEEPEAAELEKPGYAARSIIEKAGLLSLLPEGTHQIGEPSFIFAEHGMGGIISDVNLVETKDGRNAWILTQ
jgi:hypothetical protein